MEAEPVHNIPDLIRGSIGQQKQPTVNLIAKFIEEFVLEDPTSNYNSLLYMGCNNGTFFVENVLPLIPDNFTKIIACDLNEQRIRSALANYAEKVAPRVIFIPFDILHDPVEQLGSFDCIMSVRCVRVMFPGPHVNRFLNLMNNNGCGCVIYDVNDYLQDTIRTLSCNGTNAALLFGRERRIPSYIRNRGASFAPAHILNGLTNVRRISHFNEAAKMMFHNPRELQEQMEQQFSITDEFYPHTLVTFYDDFYNVLIQHPTVLQLSDYLPGISRFTLFIKIECIAFK